MKEQAHKDQKSKDGTCKSCKKTISKWASNCPHCEVSMPNHTKKDQIISFLVICLVAWFFFSGSDDNATSQNDTRITQQSDTRTPQEVCNLLGNYGFTEEIRYKNDYGDFKDPYYTCKSVLNTNQSGSINGSINFVAKGQQDKTDYYKIVVYGRDTMDQNKAQSFFLKALEELEITIPQNLDLGKDSVLSTTTHTFQIYSNGEALHGYKVYENSVPVDIKSIYESE